MGTNVTMMRTIEVFNCMKRVEFQSQNVGICSNWYNRGCMLYRSGSIGSGNGLMSDGTKALPESMWISH